MASKANLVIDQGSTYNVEISLKDTNGDDLIISGYTSRAQMRKHYTSTNAVSFTTEMANGSLSLSLSANQTIDIVAGRYVYDVELIDNNGVVTRIVEGIATVTPEVCR